ncbi:MAG: conjugal transfer protein TraF [Trichloromonadaceae bacterium]
MLGLTLGCLISSPAAALDTFMVGPRALGMAGANVASTSDTSAQYYNPAAFGFFGCRDGKGNKLTCDNNNIGRKNWGMDLSATAGYIMHNEFGTYLDDLANIDHDLLSTAGINTENDLRNLISLVRNLDGLDQPGNAVTANLNAGLGVRFGNFAIGGRAYGQANGQVLDIDETNLGISGGGNLNTQIESIALTGTLDGIQLFSPTQVAQLDAAGLSPAAIERLDFLARSEGVTSTQIQGTTDLLAQLATQSLTGGGALENNTTTVALRGFAVAEIPLSYGRALNDNWSVGANLKLMRGRVYGTEILVFDNDSGDVLAEAKEDFEESNNLGLDVGIMGRYPMVNFGIVGRNLNAPSFDGFSKQILAAGGGLRTLAVDSVTLDPQVAVGLAWIPIETLTLETNYDLTKNKTVFPGYDTQNLAFGLEWDAGRVLALRAGTYKNLAEKDIDWVYTAGIGLNLWGARFDLAGAMSEQKTSFDGDDVPNEAQLSAQLSLDF